MDPRKLLPSVLAVWLLTTGAGCEAAGLSAGGLDPVCRNVVEAANACYWQCVQGLASREFGPCGTSIGRRCSSGCCPTGLALGRCSSGLSDYLRSMCQHRGSRFVRREPVHLTTFLGRPR